MNTLSAASTVLALDCDVFTDAMDKSMPVAYQVRRAAFTATACAVDLEVMADA
jgi:hypothetical protein